MNTTIRGHNLRVTVMMALLAVLLLLAVVFAVVGPATSDGDGNPATTEERRRHWRVEPGRGSHPPSRQSGRASGRRQPSLVVATNR